jgi:hypothetical protein
LTDTVIKNLEEHIARTVFDGKNGLKGFLQPSLQEPLVGLLLYFKQVGKVPNPVRVAKATRRFLSNSASHKLKRSPNKGPYEGF